MEASAFFHAAGAHEELVLFAPHEQAAVDPRELDEAPTASPGHELGTGRRSINRLP